MSYVCLAWAARQQPTSSVDKLVLVQLASHVNARTGVCNPSIALLARECVASPRRVITAIQNLEALGLITVIRTSTDGKKNVNHYKLSTGVVNHVHHVVNDVHEGSEHGAHGVVNNVHINIEGEQRIEQRKDSRSTTPVDNVDPERVQQKVRELTERLRVKGSTSPRTPFRG